MQKLSVGLVIASYFKKMSFIVRRPALMMLKPPPQSVDRWWIALSIGRLLMKPLALIWLAMVLDRRAQFNVANNIPYQCSGYSIRVLYLYPNLVFYTPWF